jgi:small neutral amino acid transporter SnatA (MarC family)
MSDLLLFLVFFAAVNPLRSRVGLPEGSDGRMRPAAVVVGAAVSLAVIAALAWWSAPILDALEITPETFRIAAGLVAVLAGAWGFVVALPATEPPLGGWRDGLWPIAYPRILAPEVLLLAMAGATQNGVGATIAAATAAVAGLATLGAVRGTDRTTRLLVAGGRVLAVLLVVAGVFLMVDGIRDV